MAEVTVGAFDPIEVVGSQISDLIQITEAFKNHPNLTALDYLRAAYTVKENLMAVVHVTISSIMQEVVASDRCSEEDLATHRMEMEANMGNPEEKVRKALERLAKTFTIELPDHPGGDD